MLSINKLTHLPLSLAFYDLWPKPSIQPEPVTFGVGMHSYCWCGQPLTALGWFFLVQLSSEDHMDHIHPIGQFFRVHRTHAWCSPASLEPTMGLLL